MEQNALISLFCDADKRITDKTLCDLAESTPISMLTALAQVEYLNAWAEGVERLFDPQDFWNWTKVKAQASDPMWAKWKADGAPTCGATWSGDYSKVLPEDRRDGYIGE